MIPFKSVLPPDMDSNQTLTASCRADVWAGAIFIIPEDTERRGGDRWQGHNSKVIRHMRKNKSRTQKEQSRTKKSKEITKVLYGELGCT